MSDECKTWSRNTFHDNKKLTVINFFGGPGCGKSTAAAELFSQMKKLNYKVELVHEVAKDYVWEEWSQIFGEQDYIFAHQHRLIRRLTRHDIDYAIVDSSILLSLFYMPPDFPQSFRTFVKETFDTYDNINIFLRRSNDIPYVEEGRNETFEEAVKTDKMIRDYFDENGMQYWDVLAGEFAVDTVMRIVKGHGKWVKTF